MEKQKQVRVCAQQHEYIVEGRGRRKWMKLLEKRICNEFSSTRSKRKHSQKFEWSHEIRFYAGAAGMFFFFFPRVLGWVWKWRRFLLQNNLVRFVMSIIPPLSTEPVGKVLFVTVKAKIYRTIEEDFRLQFTMKAFLRFFAFNSIAVFEKFIALSQQHSFGGFKKS